ncbi:hypothetical protein EO087_00225 [Dyella sp. M7H15-1]|uniref:hypothetical protein n=1 Tax=Dyella sp. M7H15-1 TaxID=2501295 RepID=UPI00100519F8|nr:hypothetical protein [Dyella sp. M7H15-1]QAU22591.1 hypothetical protein EO087_00225 [Dyella sp. M7H15-1]
MADIDDVTTALENAIAAVVYPNGTAQPSAIGVPAAIYPGWPTSSQLDADLRVLGSGGNGKIHITIFPRPHEKNTTRFPMQYTEHSYSPATLALSIAGQQVTISGGVSTPQNVVLIVSGQIYTYAVQACDTLPSIATALAQKIAGATAAGAVVTLPATARITAVRAGGSGTIIALTKQQQREFQITIWADTPAHRSAAAGAIDSALSPIIWLQLPDGSSGRLRYVQTLIDDVNQKASLYRRDLIYSVEYSTTNTITATQVVAVEQNNSLSMPDGTTEPLSTTYQ